MNDFEMLFLIILFLFIGLNEIRWYSHNKAHRSIISWQLEQHKINRKNDIKWKVENELDSLLVDVSLWDIERYDSDVILQSIADWYVYNPDLDGDPCVIRKDFDKIVDEIVKERYGRLSETKDKDN